MSRQNTSRQDTSLQKIRTYLHLVPVFGTLLSLWTLYGKPAPAAEAISQAATSSAAVVGKTDQDMAQTKAVSQLSVVLGLSALIAIALLGGAASSQPSQVASLRFLLASSFVGSGYFLLSIGLIFRVATNRSIRLPGISSLSRRLP